MEVTDIKDPVFPVSHANFVFNGGKQKVKGVGQGEPESHLFPFSDVFLG